MAVLGNNYLVPDFEMGLVSISPVCGCSGGCKYCYLGLRNLSKVEMNSFGIDETMGWLQSNPDFIQGKSGNILCMGSWGEIFPCNTHFRQKSFEWIKQLLALGNPMAIVTKAEISTEEAETLYNSQQYPHQLTLMETITSIQKAAQIEPGCAPAEQRFQSLYICRRVGLDTAMLINPYLKGISDEDLDALFLNCRNSGTRNVVVSPLYVDEHILKKLSFCDDLQSIYLRLTETAPAKRGLKTDVGHVIADEISENYPTIESSAKKHGIDLFYHYLCVLSRQYHRKNSAFWNNPAICRNCGHCSAFHNKSDGSNNAE